MSRRVSSLNEHKCVALCAVALLATGCPGNSGGTGGSTSSVTTTGTTSSTSSSASSGTGGLPSAINPIGGNALTCSQVVFNAVGPKGGMWSVTPATGAGTVDASTMDRMGVYDAPTSVPVGPGTSPTTAMMTYSAMSEKVSATMTVATAFPGTSTPLPFAGDMNAPTTSPFEKRFSANGKDVYAAFIDANGSQTAVFHSTDGGLTFPGPSVVAHMPAVSSATVVADAVTPGVAYLVYYSEHEETNDIGGTMRVAVSTDFGSTFPNEFVAFDTSSPGQNPGLRPDIVSSSMGHVIVAEMQARGTGSWIQTFTSGAQAANLGVKGTPGKYVNEPSGSPYLAATDTNAAAVIPCSIEGHGGQSGARIFSNGKGAACITYLVDAPDLPGPNCAALAGVYVQCSMDDGAMWTAPKQWAEPVNTTSSDKNYPTGSMSPSGKIAITWVDATSGNDEVMVAFSTAADPTTFTIKTYPKQSRIDAEGSMAAFTNQPAVAWQGDNILWLAQTVDKPILLVDKTCDDGATWSGWVNAGGYDGSSLFISSAGVVAAGNGTGVPNPNDQLVTIPLTAGTL